MDKSTRLKLISALHPARMQTFLDSAGGSQRNALTLYLWHADLTAAVFAVLGSTEVILRNAMDKQLQKWNSNQLGVETSWLLEPPATPLRSLTAGKRTLAFERAHKQARARQNSTYSAHNSVSHDDVLAQTTFGLWKDLLPNHASDAGQSRTNRNRLRLWNESLRWAFPLENDPVGELAFSRITRLHALRNRVSHMEPLLKIDVRSEISEAFRLLNSIDTSVADWISGSSKVAITLKQRPMF